MISVKGSYENGQIQLEEPLKIKDNTEVIITFLDDDDLQAPARVETSAKESRPSSKNMRLADDDDDADDSKFERMRQHKRYKAKGDINIVWHGDELTYPLHDYSAGGLSFISDRTFNVNEILTATISYVASGELLVMDFEIEVRGMIGMDAKYKIGCAFLDSVDEELWHTIMG